MLFRTQCLPRTASSHANHAQWQRLIYRCYASTADDPPWFQQLRAEMLHRDATYLVEVMTAQPEDRLANTLSGFLPEEWCRPATFRNPVIAVGHHLIGWNPAVPAHEMLPDGTDALQSPGEPWVRRMWAGGSLRLQPENYYHKDGGFVIDAPIAGAERIKEVRLRGSNDSAKIFVTIERRFARLKHLHKSHKEARGDAAKSSSVNLRKHFTQQLRDDEEWGDAMFKEERNLVFLKQRTQAEMDAIKAGQLAPVRYLDSPGKPAFSHTLVPSRSLLFRFSALTFNAHLIHLDRDYARNVEGHRNLLVHGPLSLTLMLQVIAGYINTRSGGTEVLDSIEYRNLAPLYCDEEMRICGLEKKKSPFGGAYDVWIEGPTGGVAVKGIVHTVVRRVDSPALTAASNGRDTAASSTSKHILSTTSKDKTTPPVKESSGAASDRRRKGLREKEKAIMIDELRGTNTQEKNYQADKKAQASTVRPRIIRKTKSKGQGSSPEPSVVRRKDSSFIWRHKLVSNKPTPEVKHPTCSSQKDSMVSLLPSIIDVDIPQQTSFDTSSQAPSEKRSTSPIWPGSRAYRRNRMRVTSHQFITRPRAPASFRRVVSLKPAKPTMSIRSRSPMRRLARHTGTKAPLKPVPLIRKHMATPYLRNTNRIAEWHSRIGREGARTFETPRIRNEGQKLEGGLRRRRARARPIKNWNQEAVW